MITKRPAKAKSWLKSKLDVEPLTKVHPYLKFKAFPRIFLVVQGVIYAYFIRNLNQKRFSSVNKPGGDKKAEHESMFCIFVST